MIARILAVLLLPSIAFAQGVTVPNTFVPGAAALAADVNSNFSAVATILDRHGNAIYHTDTAAAGSTTSGIQEAIDACEDGSGSEDYEQCIVQLPCTADATGLLISTGLAVSADGIVIKGCGPGIAASASGTYIKWAGSSGGTMLTLTSVQDFAIQEFTLDCDGESNDAGVGISFLVSGGPTQFGEIANVDLLNCTDYKIEIGPDGANSQQVDSLKFSRVRMRGAGGCLKQSSGQAVHNSMDTSECTTGTADSFLIEAGEFILNKSFIKAPDGQTGINSIIVGELALAHIQDNRFEIDGTSPVVLYSQSTSGTGGGTRDVTTFIGNVVQLQTDTATCLDWDRRGHLVFIGNSFIGGTGGVDQGCLLNVESTQGGAGTKYLDVTAYGNSHRSVWVAADFGGTLDYSRLLWTIGTDAAVNEDGLFRNASGSSSMMLMDTDVAGLTECTALNGVLSCGTDADGRPDGTP